MPRTFAVDFLADTPYSLVLDRSVATIDVEQGALESPGGATDEQQTGKTGTHAPRGPARHLPAGEASAALLSNGPEPVGVFLKWAAVRHFGCGWCCNG